MFQKQNEDLVRDGFKDLELKRAWKLAGPVEQGEKPQDSVGTPS